jgi:hypothetical protein
VKENTMSEILRTTDDGRFRVRLVQDEDCDNPRNSDSLSHVVTVPDREYANIDKTGGPLEDGWDRIKDRPDAMDLFERWAQAFFGAITLRDTPSRGASAIWYLLPGNDAADPAEYLECERRVYREWAEGETYGYVIERSVKWDRRDGDGEYTTWSPVEDCWGYIGYTYATETALSELAAYIESTTAEGA